MFTLESRFLESFRLDEGPPFLPRQTPGKLGAFVSPTPVARPKVLAWSSDVAAVVGLGLENDRELFARWFSGNELIPGSRPYATRYGGHQFGVWAGQLGDGRAILLGEANPGTGESPALEIQLKGAGPTPYSRAADGRAVLRSSLREFVASEALHHLGVPTTRALALVSSGEYCIRDLFYDGNPAPEPGAIVTRVAPSFLRFGHFQILAANGEFQLLRQLMTYVWQHLEKRSGEPGAKEVADWFKTLCEQTARLVIHWQRIGFVHGVLNTDNMSILGLTIDYGPFGFLDNYDPDWTPNTTDSERRRYRYANQPEVAYWNLQRLAEALSFFSSDESKSRPENQANQSLLIEALNDGLLQFSQVFKQEYPRMLAGKLGLKDYDSTLHDDFFRLTDRCLCAQETDFTLFYRLLSQNNCQFLASDNFARFFVALETKIFYRSPESQAVPLWMDWFSRYRKNLLDQERPFESVSAAMNTKNPFIVPRNFIMQTMIDHLNEGSTLELEKLMKALATPYDENDLTREFALKRPDWARTKPGCSALSCSS